MKMPGMSGDELARRLRESQPDLPIIFMSGMVEPDFVMDAAYATKPIDLDYLAKMISTALASSTRSEGAASAECVRSS